MTSLQVGAGDDELVERLDRELTAFNAAAVDADDERDLSIRITDDDGDLVAGLTGWTWGGTGGINMVWVRADRRRAGLGRQLVTAAEVEAGARGCTRMIVSSFTYQAPSFYRSLGYVETGRWLGFPADSADVMFLKNLTVETPTPVRFAVILDIPAGVPGIAYEDAVLPLLADHGGWLEQRLRTGDAATEVQLITFASRAGYAAYMADPRRAAFREQFLTEPLPTRLIEVHPT
jgi:ribosomal protein S18 acetylase RimI-like enzyme